MKFNKLFAIVLALAAVATSCSEIKVQPQGGTLLASQVKEVNNAIPARIDASFSGMYVETGKPLTVFPSSGRADDWGFPMIAYSGDCECADIVLPDSGYNWFSVCGELTSRNGNYANPYIRYKVPYNTIANCNALINSLDESSIENRQKIAQAKAMRAFAYLNLAPFFQFKYVGNEQAPTVPLVNEKTTDFANNPRATNEKMYAAILEDLSYAITNLEGFQRPDPSKIDQAVAYGLRARAYLNMEKWAEAAADAEQALKVSGATPATIAELSNDDYAARITFKDIKEHNWLWGYDMTTDIVLSTLYYATPSSWIRSLPGDGYSAGAGVYACCNKILWDKIPETDVRKGWWVDENLKSPLSDNLQWKDKGPVATAVDGDVKVAFLPYTNVKFGMYSIATEKMDEDWCYMRAEEMYLIMAEGQYKSGNQEAGKQTLENFIKTYRDPSYSAANPIIKSGFENEIWFQRRVELWGEGFANNDCRRLGKPLVRFVQGKESNWPDAFKFNMRADDGWWLLRFPDDEMNTNLGIVNNTGGAAPVEGQEPGLTDGVTD